MPALRVGTRDKTVVACKLGPYVAQALALAFAAAGITVLHGARSPVLQNEKCRFG